MVKIDCFFFKLTSGGADIFYSYVALFSMQRYKAKWIFASPFRGPEAAFCFSFDQKPSQNAFKRMFGQGLKNRK